MKIKCEHCQLEYEKKAMIRDEFDGNEKFFCCKGCQGIFHLIHSERLDSFYEKLGNNELIPPKENIQDNSKFDLDSFKQKYIKEQNGLYEISLIIEGIHCSACVWLNEKVLRKADGVIEANINYTNNKAKIIFDAKVIKLSQIIEKIASIGYSAYPYDPKMGEERANKTKTDFYIKMAFGIFATMNVMWIAVAQYAGYFSGMSGDIKNILNIAEFLLATPTLFFSGWIFFRGAYFGLKNRIINMDLLVAAGASLAYLYSIYAMISRVGETYFDSVTMIITFILIGKFLESLSKKRAVDTIDSINSQLPTEVLVVKNGEKIFVSLQEVKVGDIIELKAGDKAVIDGVIIEGEASFDEASLTGEATPIYKKANEKILSGSINLDGVVRYKATKDFSHSMLNSIILLLEESLNKKPKIEQLANELSKYFSIVILSIAILSFLGWYFVAEATFEHSFIIMVSVIIIACPCALALATPVATLVGLHLANSKGILFKEARFLETMAKADILALDKTGTITEGKPQVINSKEFQLFNINILYSLVLASKHPISGGVKNHIEKNYSNLKETKLFEIKTIQAKGIKAKYKELEIIGGSSEFLVENGIKIDEKNQNSTMFYFGINKNLIAYFELIDKPKEGAREAIEAIKSSGVEVIMLTGDNEEVAKKIANEVGISKFYFKLLPNEKAKIIEKLQNENKIVVMTGDGINDAIALSRADIAIAMQSGADVAIDVSDVVVLNNSLNSLKNAFLISKRTYFFIKQNLAISLIYNSITIPLAIAGFVIPLVAAISMSFSSLIVVGNSMRIKNIKG